jgi:hypothetical protein
MVRIDPWVERRIVAGRLLMSIDYRRTATINRSMVGAPTREVCVNTMSTDITIAQRELSPFEQLILGLVCEGNNTCNLHIE